MNLNKLLSSKHPALILVLINALIYLLDYKIKNYYGLVFVFFGIFSYIYNLIIMGKQWTIKVEKKSKLVNDGFFKYIRHPLYLGCILVCFGATYFF
jgi:protein-S-isoprenylcysteine O-methyltransferase Ste14